jgi:RNA polymerase sigma factor (sigma-70 family)
MSDTDLQLLARYTRQHAEDAFTELVRRHLDLVFSAALRQVRSPQLAEEISQSVFTDLARNATKLKPDTILTAWLYQVTRHTAIDAIRKESRRQLREQIAVEMNNMNATANDWTHIEPLLDDAMSALDDTDRTAVLLRYFENKSLREVGVTLGMSDDAAQKRVSRAVERLREFFTKRGVTVGASGLIVVISANAVQAAPIGLAVTISTVTALGGTTLATTATATTVKTIAMTTLQKTLITATVAVLAGAGIYEARQAAQLREQNQTLQQQQAPLTEQNRQLQTNFANATNRLAGLAEENARLNSAPNRNELLKLRGETTRLRANSKELASTKATLSAMSEQQSEALKTMRESIRHDLAKQTEQQVKTLQEKLSLTSEQTVALKNILNTSIEPVTQYIMDSRTGELTEDEANKMNESAREQASQIMALLSPQQQADYEQLQRETEEAFARRDANSNSHINDLKSELNISSEQAEAVLIALSRATMVTNKSGEMQSPPPEYVFANTTTEELQQRVEKRVQALTSVLTPEQLKLYRESELKKLVFTRDELAQQKAMMQLLKSDGK